jgi:S1-C subfamily serine protease
MWVQVAAGLGRGHAVEIGDEPVTLGSGSGCALVVGGPGVEPLHASLVALPEGRVELRDLNPGAGATFVDGTVVDGSAELEGHEEIRLGESAVVRLSGKEPARHDEAPDPELAEALTPADERAPRRRLRDLGRSARRATALAALALLVAAAVGVFALTRGGDSGGQPSVSALVKDAAPGIVRITASAGRDRQSGSGVVVDAGAGLIVTNFHVVNGASDFGVTVGGRQRSARLVGGAPCEDLALLAVDQRDGLHALALGSESDVEQGEPVVAIGYPAGGNGEAADLSSTSGVVSVRQTALRAPNAETADLNDLVQTDAAINPGNSGGPLIDADRHVIGINSATLLSSGGVPIQNTGYAIGVDRVKAVVGALRRHRSASWPGFGLLFLTPAERRRARVPAGAVAFGAVPGTPAERAGFGRTPVVVTAVDGRQIGGTMAGWCRATSGRHSGDDASLRVVEPRTGRARTVRLVFA